MAPTMSGVVAKGWDHLANTPQAQFEAEAIRIGIPVDRAAEMARLPAKERSTVLAEFALLYREKAAGAASCLRGIRMRKEIVERASDSAAVRPNNMSVCGDNRGQR